MLLFIVFIVVFCILFVTDVTLSRVGYVDYVPVVDCYPNRPVPVVVAPDSLPRFPVLLLPRSPSSDPVTPDPVPRPVLPPQFAPVVIPHAIRPVSSIVIPQLVMSYSVIIL